MAMKTSQAGQAFIKVHEAIGGIPALKAYLDNRNPPIPTIAWGTIRYPNGQRVKMGDTCTPDQAQVYFLNDLSKFETQLNGAIKVPLTQNQFDALASLVYNIGFGVHDGVKGDFADSMLLDLLNKGQYRAAAAEFPKWNKVRKGGQLVPDKGLSNRRADEMATFLKGTTTLT